MDDGTRSRFRVLGVAALVVLLGPALLGLVTGGLTGKYHTHYVYHPIDLEPVSHSGFVHDFIVSVAPGVSILVPSLSFGPLDPGITHGVRLVGPRSSDASVREALLTVSDGTYQALVREYRRDHIFPEEFLFEGEASPLRVISLDWEFAGDAEEVIGREVGLSLVVETASGDREIRLAFAEVGLWEAFSEELKRLAAR